MFKYKVITDSSAGFSKEEAEKLGVYVLPLTLSYDGKDYKDGMDISTDGFYELFFNEEEKKSFGLFKKEKEFPKTSMVSPAVFQSVYEEIIDDGYVPVVLCISSVLSGTFKSANLAKDIVENDDIIVVDSQSALGSVKVMIKSLLQKEYETKEELLAQIDYLKKHINFYAVMDTLTFMAKGGRMSKFAANFGNFLHFKPVVQLDVMGTITPIDKPRGLKHAFASIANQLDKNPVDPNYPVEYGYSTVPENITTLSEICKDKVKNYTIGQISPVVGVHVGPGASALFYVSQNEVDKNLN